MSDAPAPKFGEVVMTAETLNAILALPPGQAWSFNADGHDLVIFRREDVRHFTRVLPDPTERTTNR